MRDLPEQLNQHLASEVTTLATCWKIERKDGLIFGFTDYDQVLEIDNIIYDSIAGFTPTNIESSSELSVDNLDIAGQTYKSKISRKDLIAGIYDFAKLEIFLVNYNQPNSGKLIQKTGIIGEVTLKKNSFYAEIRSLSQFLSQTMCESYSPYCRAQLGDKRCKFDLNKENYTAIAQINEIINSHNFLAKELKQDNEWFKYGYLVWNSGKNVGTKMEIKEFANSQITLSLPMPFPLNIGDKFSIIAGCDKSKNSCINKFNNMINFRGEPDLPGLDQITKSAGTSR